MNILYLCDEYPPGRNGGIGTAVQLLARQMAALGHSVFVAGFYDWGYGGNDSFKDGEVTVYRFRRKLPAYIFKNPNSFATKAMVKALKISGILQWDIEVSIRRYGLFLNELIKKHGIDIVEMPDYNDYMRFCKSYISFPVLEAPVVVKLHGSITYFTRESNQCVPGYIWQMEHDIIQLARSVCSVSKYTATKTAEYLNYSGQISVQYNGVAMPVLSKGILKEPGKVIFTGSLAPKKGVYQLMKAWNIVSEKNAAASLYIYGKGPIDKLKSLLLEPVRDSVHFMGHINREDLLSQLMLANVGVFPSYAETFGLGAVEAMACNTATIFTKRTSGPEVIEDGESGLLIDPDNVQEIAESILFLLNSDDDCARIAANGREHVSKYFEISKIATDHTYYYESIVGGKHVD